MQISTQLLETIYNRARTETKAGSVATYIPELAKANPDDFGLAVFDATGTLYTCGFSSKFFTIQSISKAFALLYTLETFGHEAVFSRVGKEPTGDPFNSIIRLETSSQRKPFNPFINAGAIVISSMLPGTSPHEKIENLCDFLAHMIDTNTGTLQYNTDVFLSEKATGARNRAIAWFLKELKLIDGDVEEVLDTYFMQCSIMLSAEALAKIGLILAFDGIDPVSRQRFFSENSAHICKSLMITCGLYDGSGEFAVETGIPAKSGVGGGIIAAVRDRMGIGVYGPALDSRGNSAAGLTALKLLSEALDLRVL
ncbi:MAG TPA: glutaminase A [Spirochaetia bacterium]|nr:glutaminase A [Spirochaetales bacterium]HRS64843.1 glutaminase A [Spirochaetia bacterium]HPD80365.1 glutaminase A [Spirochaetales bacterium]HQG40196.1 glutaminase A [Spirochaetales bacterium]HQK34449.1 glutaminase A [Spirochaetales bacterium]